MPWNCLSCLRPQTEDIRQLDYQHSILQDVPPEVFVYERTLEELYLDSNRIHDLPRPLFHCHGLRVLSMSDNDVQSLPPAIASLINLQHLDLSRNELSGIPDNIKGCKHLVYVDVSVNQLEKLPEGFTQLLSLEELYLNDTCLDFLPANFGRLTKLRILELRENNLNTLPKSIGRLTSLQRMDIGQNEFSDLPEVIGRLVNLTELWVDCNRIRSVPKFIGNLKKLLHFDASSNNINWIASEIGFCSSLTDLTLSCNEVQEIPETIGNLKQLVTLKLDDNQLNALPKTIGKLSNLEEFILSQNDFETLPPSTGLLRKLNILNVDDNMLEELPPEIGSCTSLTILSVRSNKLQEVPAELGHLPKIRVINLSDNQLRNLPVSILNLTFLTALWLSNNQSTPLTTLQQEVDKVTGQTVCINFMLPQSAQELYLSENREPDSDISTRHLDKASGDRRQIRFAADAESEMTGHLVRAPTPYPKELRAMAKHARSYQQQHTRRASRESDVEVPLLGEMVSPGPKGLLIKEAKVKKPSTVPLAKSTISKKIKGNEEDLTATESLVSVSKLESVDICTDESSPVLASDSGPIIREAKCVRKVTSAAEEREKFFSQKEDAVTSSMLHENSSTSLDIERSPKTLQKSVFDSPRPGIITEQPQQKPPPYHIAAAYSKQAAYFQIHKNSSTATVVPQIPSSPIASAIDAVNHADKSVTPEQKLSESKESFSSAIMPIVQLNSVAEKICSGETDERDSSRQTFKGSHVHSLEESVTKNAEDIEKSDQFEPHKVSEGNLEVLMTGDVEPSRSETEEDIVAQNAVPAMSAIESKVPECSESSLQKHSNGVKNSYVKETVALPTTSASATVTSVCISMTSTTSTTTVTLANTATITNVTNTTTNVTTSPAVTAENSVLESTVGHEICSPVVGNQQRNGTKNAPLSPKCRIPVRLGEPVCLKPDDLLSKPSTFTQDKPTASNSIFAPTPQRPGRSSPTSPTPVSSKLVTMTPKSPVSLSRAGTKIPSLLPSISQGLGKSDIKSQPLNSSPSPISEKISPTNNKYQSPAVEMNHGKSDVPVKPIMSSNWSSPTSDAETLSETLSVTRIPQPGFYSSSPLSHQSSKRASLSSQSSSNSRPGSIAPMLNTSLDSSTSPISKEAGYNYLNKPRFSATDHNLNISSKIPTATSPPSSLLSVMSGFSSLESSSSQAIPKSSLSNEQNQMVSKIPTLSPNPTSPTSARTGPVSQRLLSTSAAESGQRTSLESPGRQTKTWMFGPHKNATVFPVVIKKNPGLGFSITGGLGSTFPLEKRDNEGIFVTKVHPNGPASSCLLPGDKILEVDGTDFTKLEHDQAVGILKQTGNIVNMMISRQQ